MRATVFPLAVASLVVGNPVSALELAPAVAFATPPSVQSDSTRTATDTLRLGGRVVPAGDTVTGPILVAAGDLRIQGTLVGTAVSLLGDIIVEEGGVITGDAIAILGGVRGTDGAVRGAAKSFSGSFRWSPVDEEAPRARRGTADALALSLGWLVVLLLIGIGVLVFAGSYLDGVTDVLERRFWRSFLVGIAAELALVPLLVLVCAALAVTVVGILLIPFAVFAYILAIAGLVTLGFLAVAQLVGGGIGGRASAAERRRALRALVLGVSLIMGAWVIAAAFQWWPVVSNLLQMLAFAVTYVAATAGLGAAVLSRGGTRRDLVEPEADTQEAAVWQTPTPVTGVVAARRPVRSG